MKLIPDWHKCLRLFSQQANAVGVALSASYAGMYDHLKENFPPWLMATLTGAIFAIGFVGRIIDQGAKDKS